MGTDIDPEETTVRDRGMVTVPAHIRDRLDIEAGDSFRWQVTGEDRIVIEINRQRTGAFDGFDAEPMAGDSMETHEMAGVEPAEDS